MADTPVAVTNATDEPQSDRQKINATGAVKAMAKNSHFSLLVGAGGSFSASSTVSQRQQR
jgi:hypothetical protein